MTAPLKDRNGASAAVRRALRDAFGLWPMHEAKTKLQLGRYVPELTRFEDGEVARLDRELGPRPETLVATVMPTFKRPGLLPAAVESALAQTVTDQQVIVVDDGGGGLPTLPDDPRLSVVSLSRNSKVLGLVRNVGIRLTRSRYLAFLDDDNTWREDHLEQTLAVLGRGADLVYSAVERRRADGTVLDVLSEPFDRKTMVDDSPYVDSNSIVLRRADDVLFSRIPRVKATLPKEDWEFVHRMSRTRVVQHVPHPTVRYLVNEDSYYTAWKQD
ncbi:glycosyltransferase family 2 protein [Actinokineospora auranticolor]|uniref:Glycosyl transferase family 2 n=1 Tax=Actinokineospora auranticolor TaxID=155976 RepID=A0A2S6GH97_9PSEU|nr:glycosyltransferase family 2 protein [Actinokineospora auranticolor]PPK64516.1 glycosyl transferase family 2 [Actinokineospora auranticolor]